MNIPLDPKADYRSMFIFWLEDNLAYFKLQAYDRICGSGEYLDYYNHRCHNFIHASGNSQIPLQPLLRMASVQVRIIIFSVIMLDD